MFHKMEKTTDFVQSIPGLQACDEEDVETWMTCDAEDCGNQRLNDDETDFNERRIRPCLR
ncbi:UNVERIFIED_CONTAM: hypothetical protein NCL1_17162 [Trichonephila clavipes]